MRFSIRYPGILLIFLLTGCLLHQPGEPESYIENLPETFKLYTEQSPYPEEWWTVFGSRELNELMSEVFSENLTIEEAQARLIQANSTAVKTGAARWPELSLNGGYSRSRQKTDLDSESDGTRSSDSYSAGLSISSFEVDLWGRVRSSHEAARLDRDASVEDLRTAYLTVSVEVVTNWLELIMQRESLRLLSQQLISNQQSLDLINARFKLGQSTVLDVYQQRLTIASVRSLLPTVEARIVELENNINVLRGRYPGTELIVDTATIPTAPELPETGLPADIVAGRADVRKAGMALNAAEWRLGAAKADRLPAIRLTASLNYGASDIDLLFSNWVATLAGSLTGPVFDAGRRKAEVERTRGVVRERIAAYRRTVLDAVAEVQNAMLNHHAIVRTAEAQYQQLETTRATLRESQDRYRKGSIDYLPVLTALTQTQQLERTVLNTRFQVLIKTINLIRALGGPELELYMSYDSIDHASAAGSEMTVDEGNENE